MAGNHNGRRLDPYEREGGSGLAIEGPRYESETVAEVLQRGINGSPSLSQAIQKAMNLGGADAVTKPYLESSWIHACLSLIGESFSQLPFRIYASQKPHEGEQEVPPNDPLRRLLDSHTVFNGPSLHQHLVHSYLEDGDVFWFFDAPLKSGGKDLSALGALCPVRGGLIQQELNPEGTQVIGWKQGNQKWTVEQSVQFSRFNPYSHRGIGIVTALFRTINNYYQAERYDDAIVKNGGQPSTFYSTDQPLAEPAARRLQGRIDDAHDTDNHGRPMVLHTGLKPISTAQSAREMEFPALRKWYRDLIFALFRTPSVMFGIEDEGGFSRAGQKEKRRAYHEDSVSPLLRIFEGQISRRFLRRLPGPFSNYRVEYDDTELREDTLDEQLDRMEKLTGMGFSVEQAATAIEWKPEGIDLAEVDESNEASAPGLQPSPPTDSDERSLPVSRNLEAPTVDEVTSAIPSRSERIKAFGEGLIPHDDALARVFESAFTRYVDEAEKTILAAAAVAPDLQAASLEGGVTRAFTDAELESVLPSFEAFSSDLIEDLEQPLAALVVEQSAQLVREMGFGAAIDATDAETISFLLTKRILVAEGTMSTLAAKIKAIMLKVTAEGGGVLGIADALREHVPELRDAMGNVRLQQADRALLIARTETTSAANGGRLLTMRANGIVEHEWASSGDSNVRDHHKELDRTIRTVGDEFGYGLRFPGDSNGGASEVANCRCTTLPVVPE